MLAGWPYRCTATIARVRGVIFFSTSAGSMLKLSGSQSTNTGVAPHSVAPQAVAMNVLTGMMTSSPREMPSDQSTRWLPAVPELTPQQNPAPCSLPKLFSNSETDLPSMNAELSRTPLIAASISGLIEWYCAFRSTNGTRIPILVKLTWVASSEARPDECREERKYAVMGLQENADHPGCDHPEWFRKK